MEADLFARACQNYPELDPAEKDMPGLRLSYSTINAFMACPRKFEMDRILSCQLPMREERNLTLSSGTAMHSAWQEYMRTRNRALAIYKLMETFDYQAEREAKPYQKDRFLENCLVTLDEVIRFYDARPHLQVATINGRPAIEVNFRFNLTCTPLHIWYGGFVDVMMFDTRYGTFEAHDLKNHRDEKTNPLKYRHSLQLVPYSFIAQLMENIDSIDARSGTTISHEVASFNTHYTLAFLDLLEPRVEPLTFLRGDSDIRAWISQTRLVVEMIERFATSGEFPRYGNSCISYNKPCFLADKCEIEFLRARREAFTPMNPDAIEERRRDNLQDHARHDLILTIDFGSDKNG